MNTQSNDSEAKARTLHVKAAGLAPPLPAARAARSLLEHLLEALHRLQHILAVAERGDADEALALFGKQGAGDTREQARSTAANAQQQRRTAGPKPEPGVVTTLAFSRISVKTSHEERPGKCTQT